MKERTVDDIVETLRHAKNTDNRGCALLLGAGCSVSAGVPLAAGFVAYVKKHFPAAYDRATEKTYPKVMHELTQDQRRDLVAEEVDRAKMNWAHIAIAQLVKEGYVDRVLTTNFDRLVAQACAMVGVFPAVYDFAASQDFEPENVPDTAIFHLHGQRTGFKLMITQEAVASHAERLRPVMENTGHGRTWVVVGYSGENDGVFDNLAAAPYFGSGLYWAGYNDEEPAAHVKSRLLDQDKDAYLVRGFDADRFFIALARKLECFPPAFADKPFSHVAALLETLTEFPADSGDQKHDFLTTTKNIITRAIDTYESRSEDVQAANEDTISRTPHEALEMAASALMMAGKYDDVQAIGEKLPEPPTQNLADAMAWSHVMQANALSDQANTKSGGEADRLFAEAGEKYQKALAIKPDFHEALNNWGTALSDQANTKSGAEADRLFAEAGEKYQAALAIKPDFCEALNNLGTALLARAKIKSGAEADRLFAEAEQKFLCAEELRPGMGAYNLACVSALRDDPGECRRWLEKARDAGTLPDRPHLEADSDLDSVRGEYWFQELLRKA